MEILNGVYVPQIGVAAFRKDTPSATKAAIKDYLSKGIRFFEIAELFCNAHIINEALIEEGMDRTDIYIALKVWPKNRTADMLYNACKQIIEQSKLQYIDIVMVHAPIDIENRFDQWKALENLIDDEFTRALGIVNISLIQLMTILKKFEKSPAIFELEVHPFNQQKDLVDFCLGSSVYIVTNEPASKGLRSKHTVVKEIADKFNISSEELMFRWSMTKGYITLIPPNARNLEINMEKLSEPLSSDIMAVLEDLDEGLKSSWAPSVEDDD